MMPVQNHWFRKNDKETGPVTREQREAELVAISQAIAAGRVKRLPPAGVAREQWTRSGARFLSQAAEP